MARVDPATQMGPWRMVGESYELRWILLWAETPEPGKGKTVQKCCPWRRMDARAAKWLTAFSRWGFAL